MKLPSISLGALLFCAVSILIPAHASTLTVSNTNDSGSGSLRQALSDANAAPDEDTIAFDSAVFASARTITLSTGELPITQSISIVGPGARLLTISGNSASRVFNVSSGTTATISGLTITGGYVAYSVSGSIATPGIGGGI